MKVTSHLITAYWSVVSGALIVQNNKTIDLVRVELEQWITEKIEELIEEEKNS